MQEQKEFLVKDCPRFCRESFPYALQGHVVSAADTESFTNPAASEPKRMGPLLVPWIPSDMPCLPEAIFHCLST